MLRTHIHSRPRIRGVWNIAITLAEICQATAPFTRPSLPDGASFPLLHDHTTPLEVCDITQFHRLVVELLGGESRH